MAIAFRNSLKFMEAQVELVDDDTEKWTFIFLGMESRSSSTAAMMQGPGSIVVNFAQKRGMTIATT